MRSGSAVLTAAAVAAGACVMSSSVVVEAYNTRSNSRNITRSSNYALEFHAPPHSHVEHSYCQNEEEFDRAYSDLVRGFQSYLELLHYSLPSTTDGASRNSGNQLLKELVRLAPSQSVSSDVPGKLQLGRRQGSQTQTQAHQFLRRSQSQSNKEQVPECRGGRWCATIVSKTLSTLSSRHCYHHPRRRQRRRLVLSQSAAAAATATAAAAAVTSVVDQPSAATEIESGCEWIARQELPGCLEGATVLCSEYPVWN